MQSTALPSGAKLQREFKQLRVSKVFPETYKGWRSKVYKTRIGTKIAAIKVAKPSTITQEYKILKSANKVGVGPRVYNKTKHTVAMQFVHAQRFDQWVETATKKDLRKVLLRVLTQARTLDKAGINHGQLSTAPKHILIRKTKPYLIDFEKGSLTKLPRNMTAVCHYFFLNPRSFVARTIRTKLNISGARLKWHAQAYRTEPRSAYRAIRQAVRD